MLPALLHLSPHPVRQRRVERFTCVDYLDRLALVAEVDGTLIAVARFDRHEGTTEAEVAFVVADEYQHHGIGSLLLDELVLAASERGITTFLADTLSENHTMLDVFLHAGFEVQTHTEYGTRLLALRHHAHRVLPPSVWPPREQSRQVTPHLSFARSDRSAAVLIVAGPSGACAHDGGRLHPEQQGRIFSVMDGVRDLYLDDEIEFVTTPKAELEDLARVHSATVPRRPRSVLQSGRRRPRPDTYARSDSFSAARRAAGAGLEAIAALERRGDGSRLHSGATARPPCRARPRHGILPVNNVAVSAASLAAKGHRVLIVDWDVHHGNGTQAIFWDDPNVLYVSTHQWPLFPGTGRAEEVGGPDALGLTVNIPLPPGATGDVVRCALDEVAQPVIDRFAPDWVLVSCGFDAHRADPLGELALSTGDFAQLAQLVRTYAPRPGRLALFLEGGYNARALRSSMPPPWAPCSTRRPMSEVTNFGRPGARAVRAAKRARDQAVDAQGLAHLTAGSQW